MKTLALSRRAFLLDGAKAASLLALGCGAQDKAIVDAGGLRDAGPQYDAIIDSDAGERCLATRPDIEGPFFKPSSPETPFLLQEGSSASVIIVRGRIVDESCRPIEGAIVDFWQADEAGAYDSEGFSLRGHQRVGADGLYQLTTIVPGRYLNGTQYRPAHLHCKVIVEGRELLTTQLYFEGDPFNEVDPWFSELTMLRPRTQDSALVADFDFSVPA
jgi:protocatechuate 3,4-dioxygenase beta subunit